MESTAPDTPNALFERSSWVDLAAVIAAYVLIVFALCPGNALIGFPVHRDDFSLLSYDTSSLGTYWARGHGFPPRPISALGWTALSMAGLPAYYISLQALTILYAFLSLAVLRKLLAARRMPIWMGFLVAAAALSVECAVEYSKYTGLITSLLSGVFAVGAMSLMASQRGRPQDGSLLRAPAMAAIWTLCALSFWSKEDFVLPAILLAVYLAVEANAGTDRLRWFTLAGGTILLGALLAVYNRAGHSAFTQSGAGPYQADFNPLSVYRTAVAYLFMSPVAGIATALQVSMLIWNLIAPTPVRWIRLGLVQVLILLLVLPYCVLPNHTAFYYVFNWTVWQIGAALIMLWSLSGRAAVRWAVALIAALCVAVGEPGRLNIADFYRNAAQVNRNVVASLRNNAEALRPYRDVAIEGAPFLGPFASDGHFLNMRYGLDHDWIVRVPRDSDYFRTTLQLNGTAMIQGRVRTVAMEDGPRPPGIPVLKLSPDGTGVLELPGLAIKEAGRVRIKKVYPDSTPEGAKFQVQPNGLSAIAIEGANFQPGAIVHFNGRDLQSEFGSAGFISALIPDDLISRVGTIKVQVVNPSGAASNEIDFHVTSKTR
jgi:hypothetical protein